MCLVWVWDVGGDLVEPELSLSFGLLEGSFLLCGSGEEGKRQKGTGGELHNEGLMREVREEWRLCRLLLLF